MDALRVERAAAFLAAGLAILDVTGPSIVTGPVISAFKRPGSRYSSSPLAPRVRG